MALNPRSASLSRNTAETSVSATLCLDGTGQADISTGVGFLDHLLTALTKHAGFDLTLRCQGDLHVDDHHTAEDCALVIGACIDQALGERRGIVRFGSAYAPLDEALARAVVDLSGRPWPEVSLDLQQDRLGTLSTQNVAHVIESLAVASRSNVHVEVLRGRNDHHKAEAAFKALALALRAAVTRTGSAAIPSTKGVLA